MIFTTLNDALATRRSSDRVIHYIEGDNKEHARPFGELYARALGLLQYFQSCGARPGSEMILLVDRNEQFIDAFWACVLGGIVAVPLALGTTDEHLLKLFRVLRKLGQPHLCTERKIFDRLAAYAADNALTAEIGRIRPATVFLDQIDDVTRPGRAHAARADDIAFVQYSSGSTSEPRGVALTHRNLMTNITAIAHGIDLGESDSGLSWMPLTHDMGLIGFHLTPFVMNVSHHLMPTAVFVRRPQSWLAEASDQRATVLCSPNFGYRHFLRTFDAAKAELLDLSQVRVLFNGAEPISVELCREFLAALAPCGLRPSAMFPVYGLAEASLAVTFPKLGAGYSTITVRRDTLNVGTAADSAAAADQRAVTLMQLGHPVLGCEVRIAGETGAALAHGTVGHVRIRGDSVCRGYYRDPQSTQAAIGVDGWLDTGDLGFMSGGGLTITGRAKEVLFVSGQNYYPHDIEAVIEKHSGLAAGKAAVCGVRADNAATDEVLAFVLYRGAPGGFLATARTIRKCVNRHVGIIVSHVIPVARIPKTTSGKVQRHLLAAAYQRGEFREALAELHELSAAASATTGELRGEIERDLKEICDAFFKDRPVGVHDNLFELGTSSLTLAQIYQRVETLYPDQIEVNDFFEYPTIAELAQYLEDRLKSVHA